MSAFSSAPPRGAAPAKGRRLDLDVVRGLAIVLALGYHFSKGAQRERRPRRPDLAGRHVGWAGVDLFFVLSGFLLGRLALTEQARTGRFDGRRFTAAPAAQALAGAVPLPRRPGDRRGRSRVDPTSGRTRCTCRTTRARR